MTESPHPKDLVFTVARVKLDPSMTERELNDTIFRALPPGLEVKWGLLGGQWPVDSEGLTWVPLWVLDPKRTVDSLIDSIGALKGKLAQYRELAGQIARL